MKRPTPYYLTALLALTTLAPAQTTSAPSPESILQSALPDLASNDFSRRTAGQQALKGIPPEHYELLQSRAAAQQDPEVKASLEARVSDMLHQLRTSADPALRAAALSQDLLEMPSAEQDPGGKKMLPARFSSATSASSAIPPSTPRATRSRAPAPICKSRNSSPPSPPSPHPPRRAPCSTF